MATWSDSTSILAALAPLICVIRGTLYKLYGKGARSGDRLFNPESKKNPRTVFETS